jgi:hypothetical protein
MPSIQVIVRSLFRNPGLNAVVTISGIELADKIKKGQFKTGKLGECDATMTEPWNAARGA